MEYIIENEFLRAAVSTHGGELVSVIDRETGAEMIWQADPGVWDRHAPILFPHCGKVRGGAFTHDGVTYQSSQHGFARDMEHTLEKKQSDRVTLCLEANALTMEKFPFAFKMLTTFSLEGRTVRHTVEIFNDDDDVMPFGLGYHPGFNCPFDENHVPEDYELRFDAPQTPVVIETGSKTGLVTGRQYEYFQNGTSIPVTGELFAVDSTCFSQLTAKTFSLVEKDSGRRVTVDIEGFPYVLIWSAHGPVKFVCIEPWHSLPDTEDAPEEWMEKPQLMRLAPGETWSASLAMTFER